MATHAPLRWGILGTARINRSVIPSIRSSKYSQLLAVASREQQKAAEYAVKWEIPRAYQGYESLLADPEIDVVYISLPNSLHAEWAVKALQMGKHVLCEKPITITTAELDAVSRAAQETGNFVTEAFMYRHHPQTIWVKEMVDRSEIGKLQLIQGTFNYHNIRPADPRFNPALGGGSLWDVGCYPIGYACFLTGEAPVEVFGQQMIGETGIDLLFAGQMRFSSGVLAQFDCSFISEYKVVMEITGEFGRITVSEPFKPGKKTRIDLQKSGEKKTIDLKGKDLYQGEIEDIENAVLLGTPPHISLKQSKEIIQTIEALYLSAQQSKAITLI